MLRRLVGDAAWSSTQGFICHACRRRSLHVAAQLNRPVDVEGVTAREEPWIGGLDGDNKEGLWRAVQPKNRAKKKGRQNTRDDSDATSAPTPHKSNAANLPASNGKARKPPGAAGSEEGSHNKQSSSKEGSSSRRKLPNTTPDASKRSSRKRSHVLIRAVPTSKETSKVPSWSDSTLATSGELKGAAARLKLLVQHQHSSHNAHTRKAKTSRAALLKEAVKSGAITLSPHVMANLVHDFADEKGTPSRKKVSKISMNAAVTQLVDAEKALPLPTSTDVPVTNDSAQDRVLESVDLPSISETSKNVNPPKKSTRAERKSKSLVLQEKKHAKQAEKKERELRRMQQKVAQLQKQIEEHQIGSGKKEADILGRVNLSGKVLDEGTLQEITDGLASQFVESSQTAQASDVDNKAVALIPPEFEDESYQTILPGSLTVEDVDIPQPPVPYLEYGLDRVLFNPGVYQLQDRGSRVYNFDPYLEGIMPVSEFDFNALKEYKTSSQDTALAALARQYDKKYIGSTSSMTTTLAQFHYLLSNNRPINLDMMSSKFRASKGVSSAFTKITRAPASIFLRLKNGSYAIDADKEYDGANILMLLGKSLELLLTLPKSDYEVYRKSDPRKISEAKKSAPESYQYTTMGDFLMRSQLDAYDPRLPGRGTFDLKTRATLPIRMSALDYKPMIDYEIQTLQGLFSSYEREFYDMMRATMLKYMLQVRMGRMSGIFVAYHNIQRMFGFQYLALAELDNAMHGQTDPCLGDQEFKASLKLLNEVLSMATAKFPGQSLRLHVETPAPKKPGDPAVLHVFAEPCSEAEIDEIQGRQKAKVAEAERLLKEEPAAAASPYEGDDAEGASQDAEKPVMSLSTSSEQNASQSDIGNADFYAASASADSTTSGSAGALESTSNTDEEVGTHSSVEIESFASGVESSSDDKEQDHNDNISDWRDAPAWHVNNRENQPGSMYSQDAAEQLHNTVNPNLFHAVINVENYINGSSNDGNRPSRLKEHDTWSIKRTIQESPITQREWALYEEVKARRRDILGAQLEIDEAGDGEGEGSVKTESPFIKLLLQFVKDGREYRKQLDKEDAGKKPVIFGPLSPVREKIGGVDDYVHWLYEADGV